MLMLGETSISGETMTGAIIGGLNGTKAENSAAQAVCEIKTDRLNATQNIFLKNFNDRIIKKSCPNIKNDRFHGLFLFPSQVLITQPPLRYIFRKDEL
jgi:hypothetical protein